MKYIEVDEELYRFIAGKTERIGESASDILRRLLGLSAAESSASASASAPVAISEPSMEAAPALAVPAVKEVAPAEHEAAAVPASQEIDFANLLSVAGLDAQKGAVGRFLFALESLYQAAPTRFEQVLQIQGRDRLYFATSKDALLKASKSANPKEIGSSGFWVTTNNNTAKKRTILEEALVQLGCSPERAKSLGELALA
ncbi:replication initiation negative regulator SeqA [Shewanella sp. JM162201]|uniref:Negative modulator of initiation of replication n=1 Tax=Shewanella jiangmenensis TaxID=2837387 RepID=A0ABS5V7M4_9GAMM|nr:replication initiation negative regulator SeqA [Shewanella jiangmenensis]MBT1445955.1 replication initiation negative regulator SeqA [Shewanella jiangmenensis]